jgi:phosphopantothenoylcysteine synthetase/decarboxylase
VIVVSVGPTAGALTAHLVVRELAAAGHEVQVILEPGTEHFVGPGSFLSASRVVETPAGVPDAVLFLPATAGTLARLSRGLDHPAGGARAGGAPSSWRPTWTPRPRGTPP